MGRGILGRLRLGDPLRGKAPLRRDRFGSAARLAAVQKPRGAIPGGDDQVQERGQHANHGFDPALELDVRL